MDAFLQAVACVMIAVILWIVLSKHGKEYALLLSLGACTLILLMMLRFMEPIVELLGQLQALGDIQPEWLKVMLKAVGIGLITEMGSLICSDTGNAALGKTLHILGTVAVLWLSIPLINSVIGLLQKILGDI